MNDFSDIPTRPALAKPPKRGEPQELSFSLMVVEGPNRGATCQVDPTQRKVLVGQSPVCELRLTDALISRRHLALELDNGGLRVTDLSSTNGTFVQGLAILDARLAGGERLQLGDTVLEVRATSASRPAPATTTHFGRLLGSSPQMTRLYPLCEKVSRSDLSLIIEGETGTGKEVLAEAIHEASERAKRPFVVFDCTTVAPSLLESTLFGHERGAFTGATKTHVGVFEEADSGTLLIDEIGDLDIALQSKLLRALESSEVRRVGGDRWIKVDVRVIVATRRDLDREVQEGRFRDDLFFRLSVARLELPPLRRRTGDVAVLAQRFWTELGGAGNVPSGLLERLAAHSWPGNVRELHNTIARLVALGDASVPLDGFGQALNTSGPTDEGLESILELNLPLTMARAKLVEAFERRYVERVLQQHGGNVSRAAEASGLARRYFQLLKARQSR